MHLQKLQKSNNWDVLVYFKIIFGVRSDTRLNLWDIFEPCVELEMPTVLALCVLMWGLHFLYIKEKITVGF